VAALVVDLIDKRARCVNRRTVGRVPPRDKVAAEDGFRVGYPTPQNRNTHSPNRAEHQAISVT
jgi:hypothetical protein